MPESRNTARGEEGDHPDKYLGCRQCVTQRSVPADHLRAKAGRNRLDLVRK